MSLVINEMNYQSLTQRDSVVASLFAQQHVDPAQFSRTQFAVREAIAAVSIHVPPDSTAVLGQNMVFVQSHRQDLATDWQLREDANHLMAGLQQKISHINPNPGTANGDLTP